MSMLSRLVGKKTAGALGGAVAKLGGGLPVVGGLVAAAFQPRQGNVSQATLPGYPGVDWSNPLRGIPGFGKAIGFAGKGGRLEPQNGQCPRGWHLNKHKLADGTPARSVCVRNRSMNPLNGRAAVRAVARVKRAEKLVRKLRIFRPVRQLTRTSGHKPGCRCVTCSRR